MPQSERNCRFCGEPIQAFAMQVCTPCANRILATSDFKVVLQEMTEEPALQLEEAVS